MFNFLGRKRPPRETLLAAIPLHNELVRVSTSKGITHLIAPFRTTALRRFLGNTAREKSFELDELGFAVWQACDGRATVEEIITDFARAHRLNLREAEVAVTTFLQMLIKRRLLALAAPPAAPVAPPRRQSESRLKRPVAARRKRRK